MNTKHLGHDLANRAAEHAKATEREKAWGQTKQQIKNLIAIVIFLLCIE